MAELRERLEEEENANASISSAKRKIQADLEQRIVELEDVKRNLDKIEMERATREQEAKSLAEELEGQNEAVNRLTKDKLALEADLEVRLIRSFVKAVWLMSVCLVCGMFFRLVLRCYILSRCVLSFCIVAFALWLLDFMPSCLCTVATRRRRAMLWPLNKRSAAALARRRIGWRPKSRRCVFS